MEGGRRRITLYDQMLAVGDGRDFAGGLTLNDVLTIHKRASSPSPSPAVRLNGRTLLDIIRDDVGKAYAGDKEKKSWKFLRDLLRLRRGLEISFANSRSQIPPPNSLRFSGMSSPDDELPETTAPAAAAPPLRPQISRRNITRVSSNASPPFDATYPEDLTNNTATSAAVSTPGRSLRPQISRRNSTRMSVERRESFTDLTDPAREGTRRLSAALAEERSLSAREAVAAQEAADAEAIAHHHEEEEEEEEEDSAAGPTAAETAAPVRMSLMDLLEETDRQMGFEGSRYIIEEDEEEEEEEEEEKEEDDGGGPERNCCVCMVRHKGAAFIPCGHTFCRLCSRELWVSRGNCPLCNGFILEILDIF